MASTQNSLRSDLISGSKPSSMRFQKQIIGSAFVLGITFLVGCGQSESNEGDTSAKIASQEESEQRVSWVHWRGKRWLQQETNAAYFMSLWKLPESEALEDQTLDKLSTFPARLIRGAVGSNDASAALLRPLLDDLVQEEGMIRFHFPATGRDQVAIAVKLNDSRATTWRDGLGKALTSLGAQEVDSSDSALTQWHFKEPYEFNRIQLSRVDGWTVLGLARDSNSVFDGLLDSLKSGINSGTVLSSNNWLEAKVELSHVAPLVGLEGIIQGNVPRAILAVNGDGENVRFNGTLKFPRELNLELEPWQIPTNLISDPLISFTAVRGIKPWLDSLDVWRELDVGPAPNQVFAWSKELPVQTYVAALLSDADRAMASLASRLTTRANPWLAAHGGMGRFQVSSNGSVLWTEVPFSAPSVSLAKRGGMKYILAGLVRLGETNIPPPPELFGQFESQNDLVNYHWELSGKRIEAIMYQAQLMRMVLGKPQLPPRSVALTWLQALVPRLGNYVLVVEKVESDQLAFVGKSSGGISAGQYHLMADWLESPEFPSGLHTIRATSAVQQNAMGVNPEK